MPSTGNVGSKLTDLLLTVPEVQLTVLARNPQKVEHLAARGARVVVGNQLDSASTARALEGAGLLIARSLVDELVYNEAQ